MTDVAQVVSEIRTVTATIRSVSPYSQSRYFQQEVPKGDKETSPAYEERTWRHRLHSNGNGTVVIPGMSFKLAVQEAAPFLGHKIPGRRNATWTKHFISGVLVLGDADTGIPAKDVEGEWLFVPSDGKRGGGTRVMKCFPLIPSWEVKVAFTILDPLITNDVFEYHLREAGKYIGIGRFRPANGGYYGRFEVTNFKWS